MKNGIIVFKETENIGDDIQSYAAMKLLSKVDYYIEREKMDLFVPKEKEKIRVLMSGWFLHYKYSFLPSPYIEPVYISTHLSSYKTYGIENEHIKLYKDYLKQHEPIGCRDLSTQNLLNKNGIANYYSGCVTLTLKRFNIQPSKEEYICCVDIPDNIIKNLKGKTDIKIKKMTHTLDLQENRKLTWEERFKNVEKLLKTYQNAKLVITSRLHCALPCLAIGVPVILVKDEKSIYYNDRLTTFMEYLNTYSEKEFLKKKIDTILSTKNDNKHLKVVKELVDSIKKRFSEEIKDGNLPEIKDYKELYINRKEKLNTLFDIISKEYSILFKQEFEDNKAVEYWKKETQIITKKYQDVYCEKEELKNTIKYWKQQYEDAVRDKKTAVEVNTVYWKNEFNELLEKYNQEREALENITKENDNYPKE